MGLAQVGAAEPAEPAERAAAADAGGGDGVRAGSVVGAGIGAVPAELLRASSGSSSSSPELLLELLLIGLLQGPMVRVN